MREGGGRSSTFLPPSYYSTHPSTRRQSPPPCFCTHSLLLSPPTILPSYSTPYPPSLLHNPLLYPPSYSAPYPLSYFPPYVTHYLNSPPCPVSLLLNPYLSPTQKNGGSRHKGAFSRLKYAHSPMGTGNSFRVSIRGDAQPREDGQLM